MKNTKKILVLLLSLLVLAGCSDGHAMVSDPNEKIFSVGDTTVTKGDIYSSLVNNIGSYVVVSEVNRAVLDIYVPVDDEINAEADGIMNNYESMYGDALDTMVTSYGYSDSEEYRNEGIVPSIQARNLYEMYVNDNWETIKQEKNPKKGVVISVEDADTANTVMNALNDGTALADVISENGLTHSGSEELIYADSDYPVEVMTMVNSATDATYVTVTCADGSIYVLSVTESDPEAIKDEVAADLALTEDIQRNALAHYIQASNFEIYDRNVYDAIAVNYPEYLD